MVECVQLQAQLRKKRQSCIQHHQTLDAGNLEAALLETMFSVQLCQWANAIQEWLYLVTVKRKQNNEWKIMRVGERTLLAKEKKKKTNHNCNTLKRTAETRIFPQLSTT